MPKRTTLTFTSEDANKTTEDVLFVYYCKYSGKHVLTIDADLSKLPQRRTDGARVIDLSRHQVKLYTTDGGMKLIKREDGRIERQYRLNVGKLPVAYKSEENGTLLYVMNNSVSTCVTEAGDAGGKMLVPPCIARNEVGQTQVRVDIEDRAHRPALVRISADSVRIHVTVNVAQDGCNEEILNLFSKILNVRLTQLQLARPSKPGSGRKRILLIDGLGPQEAFDKMMVALAAENQQRTRTHQRAD